MDLSLTSFYIKAPSGNLFVNLYSAETGNDLRHCVVHFPAFAEEMNKSRPMVNLAARKIAEQGSCVLVPDLFGCGDSEGDLNQVDLVRWRNDMLFLLASLVEQGVQSISLWGLRSGCLLMGDLLAQLPENHRERVSQVIFWQPVANGEQFIAQFLRLRVAASMMSGDKETVASLRNALADQGELEVAGYRLNAELVSQMSILRLAAMENLAGIKINWFEVVNAQKKTLPMAAKKLIEQWQQAGIEIDCREVTGDAFWSTQEIAMAPDLIDATAEAVAGTNPELSVAGEAASLLPKNFSVSSDCRQQPVQFCCEGSPLVGILHRAAADATRGVVLVVGGPQYRVGSHRQFVQLSRVLAASGIPVLRFDYRGMGDSAGPFVGFEGVENDIRAAIDEFQRCIPGIQEVVLWGLCDAATAASFYAPSDARVRGLVLANPWARSTQGEAKAFLKHYYLKRLLSRSFWKKLFSGKFRPLESAASLGDNIAKANTRANTASHSPSGAKPLIERMEMALLDFKHPLMFLLSGNDLTAREFEDAASGRKKWRKIFKRSATQVVRISQADHTFSSAEWKEMVAEKTVSWLKSW